MEQSARIAMLKQAIIERAFETNERGSIAHMEDPHAWIFDFRKILMSGNLSDLIGSIFYEQFKSVYPFQIGTLESGGIPLMMSCLKSFYQGGETDVSGFFVRKSRKKTGLLNFVEGEIIPQRKIILVDDVMNSGDSFWRQIEILESMGYRVDTVWSIIRYRDSEYYKRFHARQIKIESLFTLDDFTELLGPQVRNLQTKHTQSPTLPLTVEWVFKVDKPSLEHVVPKSLPCVDGELVYVGADNGYFYALNQATGVVVWKFKVGLGSKKKSIFSSPAIAHDLVIFGAYDGNVYALDKKTGARRWVSFEADWVGSSPAVAHELGLLFIGLEFGLFRKHGGVVALDVRTGKTVWLDQSHRAYTHASPTYLPLEEKVVIGSNEGIVRLYDARTGVCEWTFTTFGGANDQASEDTGFGTGAIKGGVAYDEETDQLVVGATDGFLYILDRKTGNLTHHFKCGFALWGTPCIHGGRVYFSSLDKRIRCIDLESKKLQFERELDGTRIFSAPVVIDGKLYIGTNGGRLYALNPETGDVEGFFQVIERITNALVKDTDTQRYFLSTYAGEVYCLALKSA